MKTKYTLTYDGVERQVTPESLKNWGDIVCSYKRDGLGGVIRRFSSEFQFVLDAYDLLLSLYLRDGVEAKCAVSFYTLSERHVWVKEFECSLDFSSVKLDGHTFSVSAFDSSLAAAIKAARGTKYEFIVGQDIETDGVFRFDRIPMRECCTYEFTQGSQDDEGGITVRVDNPELPWLGNVGKEISIGQTVYFVEDQEPNGHILTALIDTSVDFDWSLDIDPRVGEGERANLKLEVVRNGSVVGYSAITFIGGQSTNRYLGMFDNAESLPKPNGTQDIGNWATLQGSDDVWIVSYAGYAFWENTGKPARDVFRDIKRGRATLDLQSGDKVRIVAAFDAPTSQSYTKFKVYESSFSFSWMSRGDAMDIDCLKAETICRALLRKIAPECNCEVDISAFDQRLARTRLMAAESIRGIDGAKLYTSFGEFTDWMEAVFGYVLCIGEPKPAKLLRSVEIGGIMYTRYDFMASRYQGTVDHANVVFLVPWQMFFYRDGDAYYISWPGWEDYMQPDNKPLPDVIYISRGKPHVSNAAGNDLVPYKGEVSHAGEDIQTVRFCHRSELFRDAEATVIRNPKDVSYSVNASQIYSTVEVGYDKKDYQSINGRDEFNFGVTYATGTKVSDKKLSLKSKYRADSYGIEFAAQKRDEDTTDAKEDMDLFFVLCSQNAYRTAPDRSIVIGGVISDRVFNAGFSPVRCLLANAGYVGVQSPVLTLAYASADGNGNAVLGVTPISSDVTICDPIASCAEVTFATDEMQVPELDKPVRIVKDGIAYVGYISELDLKYTHTEAAKYKMIVKSISYDN